MAGKYGPAANAYKPNVGYNSIHKYMNHRYPRTGVCEDCGANIGTEKGSGTQYASIGHTYTRNRADWRELCRPCHKEMDA